MMQLIFKRALAPAIVAALFFVSAVGAAPLALQISLDATDLPGRLLHATIEIPVVPGPFAFWYPEWIPGIHAPNGPVENMAGLVVETQDGIAIPWTRDPLQRHRFQCEVPAAAKSLRIKLDYITNQPSTNSRGVDSFGNSLLGIINWNTVLVYPEGVATDDISATATLQLPPDWKMASALPLDQQSDTAYQFSPVSLTRLVDSPVLLGANMRSIDLDVGSGAPVSLHLGSESDQALLIKDELIAKYGKMVQEAYALFGTPHYDRYDFLVACSGDFPSNGLEHLHSSLNGVGERDLHKDDELRGWVGYLLPHEYVHSWCGKYRRPAGMTRPDFHTPLDTRMLWVYEGLTQYLGHVLTVRSGIWDLEHYKEVLAENLGEYMRQSGRQWRPLEDTAADSYHLRGGSRSWSALRRGQDYYDEGLLFWLEADARIREASDNKKSLDDFAKAFFGAANGNPTVFPFEEQDILDALNAQAALDWTELVETWIKSRQDALPLAVVARLGYRLEYATEPSKFETEQEKSGNYAAARHSLGISVNNEGVVQSNIGPDMPAAKAGVAPGMKIVGVNSRKFSLDRFRDAVKESVARQGVELLILDGDVFKTLSIPYADGARYLKLVRVEDKPDRLKDILSPRVTPP